VVRQGLLCGREIEVIYCTCFFSECGSSMSTRVHSHGHEEMETVLHMKFCIVNPHKCESEILSSLGLLQ